MMTRRGQSGHIEEISRSEGSATLTGQQRDGTIICQGCMVIIPTRVNLGTDNSCPRCHRHVNAGITQDFILADLPEPIAKPC